MNRIQPVQKLSAQKRLAAAMELYAQATARMTAAIDQNTTALSEILNAVGGISRSCNGYFDQGLGKPQHRT